MSTCFFLASSDNTWAISLNAVYFLEMTQTMWQRLKLLHATALTPFSLHSSKKTDWQFVTWRFVAFIAVTAAHTTFNARNPASYSWVPLPQSCTTIFTLSISAHTPTLSLCALLFLCAFLTEPHHSYNRNKNTLLCSAPMHFNAKQQHIWTYWVQTELSFRTVLAQSLDFERINLLYNCLWLCGSFFVT